MNYLPGSEFDQEATETYAHLFQALGEPTRLTVLQHLATAEHRVRDLVEHLGLAQSTVSKHLSFLLQCHLVTVRSQGRSSWYALAQPVATAAVIKAAEALLTGTGNRAVLCSHLREPDRNGARKEAV